MADPKFVDIGELEKEIKKRGITYGEAFKRVMANGVFPFFSSEESVRNYDDAVRSGLLTEEEAEQKYGALAKEAAEHTRAVIKAFKEGKRVVEIRKKDDDSAQNACFEAFGHNLSYSEGLDTVYVFGDSDEVGNFLVKYALAPIYDSAGKPQEAKAGGAVDDGGDKAAQKPAPLPKEEDGSPTGPEQIPQEREPEDKSLEELMKELTEK